MESKKTDSKKVVQREPRRLHEFFVDQGDGLKDSAIGNVLCLNMESARVTLLRHQVANGGIKVRKLKV